MGERELEFEYLLKWKPDKHFEYHVLRRVV